MRPRIVMLAAALLAAGGALAYAWRTGRFARPRSRTVQASITVDRPAEELYGFWRDLSQLPRVTEHLEEVTVLDDGRSRWRARGPAGTSVEWQAETTQDRPNEEIGWRSVEGSLVRNAGVVRFRPATGGRGTVVQVTITYEPPAGLPGVVVARLLGEEPEQQLKDALRRFKQLMEAGVISTTEGQPAGRSTGVATAISGIAGVAGRLGR